MFKIIIPFIEIVYSKYDFINLFVISTSTISNKFVASTLQYIITLLLMFSHLEYDLQLQNHPLLL